MTLDEMPKQPWRYLGYMDAGFDGRGCVVDARGDTIAENVPAAIGHLLAAAGARPGTDADRQAQSRRTQARGRRRVMEKNDGKTFSEEACPACGNLRSDAQRLHELEQINSQWQRSACEKGEKVLVQATRISALEAECAALRGKAIRFDLDEAGMQRREAEAIELVEGRARIRDLEAELAAWHNAMRDAYACDEDAPVKPEDIARLVRALRREAAPTEGSGT